MAKGRKTALRPQLSAREREVLVLTQQVASATITPQLRRRARILLLLAEGETITAIARQLGLSRTRIYKWIRRWQAAGLGGLLDQPSGPRRA